MTETDDMDLMDVRAKVSTKAHCVLVAEERATGRTHSEIIRDVLEVYAEQRVHAATVLANLLRGEGAGKASGGKT